MSDLIALLNATGSLANVVGQVASPMAGNSLAYDNSGQTWMGGTWVNRLQPGSWRGVGFVLDAGETHAGRRIALHEYPYRDDVWPEDLGKLPRRFNVTAWLIGDDVYSQRDAMIAACEQAGSGTLVHPTLGSIEVVLLDFSVTDRRERGRVVEVALQFIVASDVRFPSTTISTAGAITSAASALNLASAGDLSSTLSAIGTIPQAATQVSGFTGMAVSAVSDATRALNAVNGLAGFYGRYSMGSLSSLMPATATVQSALSLATTTRTAVQTTAASVENLASLL